jgi:hypothetical protein
VSQSHLTNPRWGFPHSRVCAAARGKGAGEGEARRGRLAATSPVARRCWGLPGTRGAGRGRGRPRQQWSRTREGRHREHRRRVAYIVKPATPSLPTRRESIRSLDSSCAAFFPCSCLWACLRAAVHCVRRDAVPPWAPVATRSTGANPAPRPPQAATSGAPNSWATC